MCIWGYAVVFCPFLLRIFEQAKVWETWVQTRGQFSKEIQVYFTSRTLVFTNSHQFESTKSLCKFPLEAPTMVFYWILLDSIGFNQSLLISRKFTCAFCSYKKKYTCWNNSWTGIFKDINKLTSLHELWKDVVLFTVKEKQFLCCCHHLLRRVRSRTCTFEMRFIMIWNLNLNCKSIISF